MKRHTLLIAFVVPLLLLLTNCALEDYNTDDLPNWSSTLELPLLTAYINLQTFLDDSLINTIPTLDGDSIYAYLDTLQIDEIKVVDELLLEPMEKNYTQHPCDIAVSVSDSFTVSYDTVSLGDITEIITAEIGLIELDNIEPHTTDPFPFREVMPATLVDYLETVLEDSGGAAHVAIDPVEMVPHQHQINFESFYEVTLASGILEITITNDMFVYLGLPLTVTVLDIAAVELFALSWEEEIPPHAERTQTVDVSGYTLPGTVLVHVAGFSGGTHSLPVLITNDDLDSGFTVRLDAQNFIAESAWTQVPSQTIEGADSIQLEESETRIEQALLATCDLQINIDNAMGLTGTLIINIPSLLSSTQEPWQATLPLPLENSQFQDNLAGWTLHMNHEEQQVAYNYTIITDATEPEYVVLSSSDSAVMNLLMSSITFSELTGTIEQQIITENSEITLDTDAQIQSAIIETGILQLQVDNRVGGEALVVFTGPELLHEGTPLSSTFQIGPGANQQQLNLAGYQLVPPSLEEQIISCNTVTTTDPAYGEYHLLDSIVVAITVSDLRFSEITGIFINAEIIEEDSLSTESDHIIEHAEVLTGSVFLDLTNYVGLTANVELQIEELTLDDEPLSRSFQISADEELHPFELLLDGYQLNLPPDRQYIDYTSTLTLISDEIVTLFRGDSLVGNVHFDTLYFASLIGFVDSLTVESDTTCESIDLLPEEMDGIRFCNVDLVIALETDIGGANTDDLSILLSVGIQATNPDGEVVISLINDWSVLDSNRVQVPYAEELLNIIPDQIEIWGSAIVNGHGEIMYTQFIRGDLEISLPFEFEITETASIDIDQELLEESIPEDLVEVALMLNLENQFEFGTLLTILATDDTCRFYNGTADTLLHFELLPEASLVDTIRLTGDKMELLIGDSTWIKGNVQLHGLEDGEGNPRVTRILASDSLNIELSGRFRFHLDLGDE